MKSLFLLILFLCLNTLAQDSQLGIPNADCQCDPQQNNVYEVIEAMSKTDRVIPIEIYYKLVKLETADLKITHVNGKILNATIEGKISAFGMNETMTDSLDIESLSSGKSLRYFSNLDESPIVEVIPQEVTSTGGSVNLNVKMRYGVETIPLTISRASGSFKASTNGQQINALRIYIGLNYAESISQANIIGGYISKYKIR